MRMPRHSRECEYVTTGGPAPCTCSHYDHEAALADLKRAVEFFDKVKAATGDEKAAVGSDHWRWLEKAARDVVRTLEG